MNEQDSIMEDPALATEEKETTITWAKDQQRVHVHSEMGSIMRRLLAHPHFEETDRRVVDGDVVRIAGTLPLGVLSIKQEPRKYGRHASVVSAGVLREGDGDVEG